MKQLIAQIVQRYRYMRECVVIGRGYNYATAFEIALKMKELTYTFIEAYSSADFLHGPLAVIEHGFPAITIAPTGAMLPEIAALHADVQAARRRDPGDQRRSVHLRDWQISPCACRSACPNGCRPSPPSSRASCFRCTWLPFAITTQTARAALLKVTETH